MTRSRRLSPSRASGGRGADIAPDGSPQREWSLGLGMRATLTHYAAAGSQPAHSHDHLQLSFVLAGALWERLERREHVARSLWRGQKPAGAVHSDRWGEEGVLVFTLRCEEGMLEGAAEPGWADVEEPERVRSLVALIASEQDEERRSEAGFDLLAVEARSPAPMRRPPRWLTRAREQMHDSPAALAIGETAREAGIHRAQLSRMFSRHFGAAPSVYRRRLLVARAAEALARSDASLALVAAESGFCDQSHLSRALRTETGLTPAQVRNLLDVRHPSKNGSGSLG